MITIIAVVRMEHDCVDEELNKLGRSDRKHQLAPSLNPYPAPNSFRARAILINSWKSSRYQSSNALSGFYQISEACALTIFVIYLDLFNLFAFFLSITIMWILNRSQPNFVIQRTNTFPIKSRILL